MDTRIPMGVQVPDFGASFLTGLQAGVTARQVKQQNALAQLYQTQGPQILAGDPASLNALARMDPQAAMGMQQNQLGMQAQQQGMAFDAERMQMVRDQAKAAVAEHAAKVTAEQLAAEAAQTEQIMVGAAPLYMQAQRGDPQARERLLAYLNQNGVPATAENLDSVMYASAGALDGMKAYADLNKVEEPQSPQGKFVADQQAGFVPQDMGMPQSGVNINMGGGTDKQIYDTMATQYDTARSSNAGLAAIMQAQEALDGGIISGFGANEQLAFQKLGAALGIADPSSIVNTETFRSAIAPLVAATLRASVGSANISNADREFAEKAVGGNITLDEGAIRRLLAILRTANLAVVADYQRKLDKIYPNGGQFDRERAIFGLAQNPSTSTPASPGVPAGAVLQFDENGNLVQ